MERPNTLQLTRSEIPKVSIPTCIKPLPGKFYAIESPITDRLASGLYLSGNSATSLKSDVCTVIAVGEGVDLKTGETFLALPNHGTWVEGFENGDYKAEGRIRIFGMAWTATREPVPVDWDESAPVTTELIAKGRRVLIKRDPVITSEHGIQLTDDSKYRSCMATVVSVGKDVPEKLNVGDRVHYDGNGVIDFLFGDDPDLAIVWYEAINAVIEQAA